MAGSGPLELGNRYQSGGLFQLHVLPADEWAARVAAELLARLRVKPDLRLCLPTGDTPAPLYAALAHGVARGDASLDRATIVLLDEYVGLPADDPARCDNQLRRDLLDRLPAPARPAHVHPIRVDQLTPEEAAAAHDAVAAEGLDLAIVGVGLNGHVGFNEPGSTADSPTRVVPLTAASMHAATTRYDAGNTPSAGVTLGLARLLESAEIWLIVTGGHKAEVLRQALQEHETPGCPASFLRRHGRLRVFADGPAASSLDLRALLPAQ